jgi:hypothetical protein
LLLEAVGRFLVGARKQQTPRPAGSPRAIAVIDPEQVRAAVTVALDAAMPALIDAISERVVSGLAGNKPKAT